MSIFFSARELVEIAIGMERNGIAFYDVLAKTTENAEVRAIYDYLAAEERRHLATFQEMMPSVAGSGPQEVYSEDYALYLKALVDSLIFSDEAMAREEAQQVTNDTQTLDIALTMEKESILFYSEMRGLVRRPQQEVVDRVIEEERSHFRQFSALKEKLVSSGN
jgi:rubrerythrin